MPILDYASRKQLPAAQPGSGVISMLAAIVQIPWAGFVAMMAWGDRWHLDSDSGARQDSPIYLVVAVVPAIVALICGIYSVKKSGFGKHNRCGSIGLSIIVCFVLWIAIGIGAGSVR